MSPQHSMLFPIAVYAYVHFATSGLTSAVNRLVIENCFDEADANRLSEWLANHGRSRSIVTLCGDVTAVLKAIGSDANDDVVAVVTFGLATSLLTASSSSTTDAGWTVYRPDRWQPVNTAIDDDACPNGSSFGNPSTDDGRSRIYLLNLAGDLYPVTRKWSDGNRGDNVSSGYCVPSWESHLQSLMRHLDAVDRPEGDEDTRRSALTVYLYYEDRRQRMTVRSHGLALGPESLVVHKDEDFVLGGGGGRSVKCREMVKHVCADGLTISKNFLRIGVIELPPFMMTKRGADGETVEYYGFLVDMIVVLAAKLNFNYTLVTLDAYGRKLPNGTWFGAMRAVIDNTVDLVVADLSMTPARVQVVDFSVPFMQGSKGVVIRRAMEVPTYGDLLRTHLRPFHWSIWLVLLATLLLSTALLTHAVTSLSASIDKSDVGTSAELANQRRVFRRRRRGQDPTTTTTTTTEPPETWWSILFQVLGIFCQQGCGLSPTLTSGRVILYTVCLTSLATYNFYTSVFISFTTVTKRPVEVNSLSDVLMDPSFHVGFVKSTRIEDIFQTSTKAVYRRAWRRMQQSPNSSYYVSNVVEGLNRAHSEKFAFIDEMSLLEWYVARNCSLKVLQNHILSEGYHLVFPKGSNDTVLFDIYLKRLQESGMVARFLANHMPQTTLDYCADVNTLEAVGLDRMAGLFICLAFGVVLTTVSLWLEKLTPDVGTSAAAVHKTVTIQIKRF